MSEVNWVTKAGAVFFLCTAAIAVPAQTTDVAPTVTFTTLHTFSGTEGSVPYAGLIQGTDGDFYGTTFEGGAYISCASGVGCGAVFRITPNGDLTTLHSFDYTDGFGPRAALVQAANGKFYGTTAAGGDNSDGTIFKITSSGTLTTLYNFCSQGGSNCTDGGNPYGALTQATNGKLYGTTWAGGDNGDGTVFKITPSGTLTTLQSFDLTDGAEPFAGMIEATDGELYGTTGAGGGPDANGTVFKITRSGTLTTLYSFCSQINNGVCTDGAIPVAALIQGTDGNFYGTTHYGGLFNNNTPCFNAGCGTVFEITSSGKLTTLYSFCSQSNCANGATPDASVVQATDGDFYGTTYYGGANNGSPCFNDGCGTIFRITRSGKLTTLYSFDGADGGSSAYPYAGLLQGTDGDFYGTTTGGTVFSLSVGLGPFVKTQPTFGAMGATVTILGTNLTGATNVTFHGIPATFTVVSSSEITTTVPARATNGKVKVATPGGVLSSNVPFRVTP